MPQFLIEPSAIKENTATITGKDARHVSQVLRLKKGDWLMLTDGQGNRWKAVIVTVEPNEVVAKIAPQNAAEGFSLPSTDETLRQTTGGQVKGSAARVALAQALIKHDRFEWIIQKAVELGCTKIIPFTSERTIPKFVLPTNQRTNEPTHKLARWQKIALEAAKQCGTTLRPVIEEPIPFLKLLKQLKSSETNILFYEGETSSNLNTCKLANLPTVVMIGPEGGFSLDEVRKAKESGVVTCGLGPLILRVETASIAAITLVQEKLGYFDKLPMDK